MASSCRHTFVLYGTFIAGLSWFGCGPSAKETSYPTSASTTPSSSVLASHPTIVASAHHWLITKSGVPRFELRLSDKPGPIVDGNSPPPPPSVKPAIHPFLSGSCVGDIPLCSEAGTLLRDSTSLEEFLRKLESAGLIVKAL